MNHAEHAARLLDDLAVALGEGKPAWKNGACRLSIEGRELSFFYGEKKSAFFVQADLGELAALPDQEAAMTALLRKNHLWAGTVGGSFGLAEGRLLYVFRLDFPLPEDWETHSADLLPDLFPHIFGALEAAEERLNQTFGRDQAPAEEAGMLRV